jgi:transcriptional regulator with XRE-family HTH domain
MDYIVIRQNSLETGGEYMTNRIKEIRTQKGLTQQQLGQGFKNPKDITVISRWERGIVIPSSEHLLELAEILQVKPNEIFLKTN